MPTKKRTIYESQRRSKAKYEASEKGKKNARKRALKYARGAGKARMEERRLLHLGRLQAIKLERGCADCGYREHPAALHFDHLPGTGKLFSLAYVKMSWENIEAEIAKCEVVCANCHAIRTAERRKEASSST